jgi:hypothetical protein
LHGLYPHGLVEKWADEDLTTERRGLLRHVAPYRGMVSPFLFKMEPMFWPRAPSALNLSTGFLGSLTGRKPWNAGGLKRCLDYLRESDTLLVTKIDRLARSTSDLYRIISTLTEKGARAANAWVETWRGERYYR